MIKLIKEVDKGYSRQVYQALDDSFKDSDGKAELVYISDAVDMWLFNTKRLYDEIFNKRRKATSIAYEALIDLFQDTVDGYDVKVRVTSEMVKQWFKRVGLSYIDALKPVVDKIEEEREEAFSQKESVKRTSKRISKRPVTEAKQFGALDKRALALYDKRDWKGFTKFTDEELAKLWSMCQYTKENPWGAAYDDEVFEAISDRPNSDEIFEMSKTYLNLPAKESMKKRPMRSKRMTESSRRKYTQKELRDLVRSGKAEDITTYSFEEANDLYDRGYDVVGVSSGVYGMNGALLKMRDTGELMAICARNSTLMQLV
jgi:hypothetical protein